MAEPATPFPGGGSSREQVSRIDRTYFQRPSRFQKIRRGLLLAALVAGAAWGAWAAFDAPRQVATGPVAAVHAKWESDCSACHVPFTPIKDNTFFSSAATRQAMDTKCEACHRGASHHPLQLAAEVGSCASCHADHRGRDADLSRVADRTCTACHGDIAAHRLVDAPTGPPPSTVVAPITRFDDDHHPPFAALATDPGRLKFSHGRHMRAGLSFAGSAGAAAAPGGALDATVLNATVPNAAAPWTYAMLAPADRARYLPAGARETDAIQLDCASCHEFGGAAAAGRTIPAEFAGAAPGAYALPVDFARHCAACHTLPFEATAAVAGDPAGASADAADTPITLVPPTTAAAGGEARDAAAVAAAATVTAPTTAPGPAAAGRVVPHGLDAPALARFLETTFLEDALRSDPRLLDAGRARRPLPAAAATPTMDASLRTLLEERFDRAVAFTRGTCEKCHEVESVPLPAGVLAAEPPRRAALGIGVGPAHVPLKWFTKAVFNHQPHRGFDCRECHAAAYPDTTLAGAPPGSPIDSGLVMIAGRESCTTCHAPAGHDPATGKPTGGVRFDCVECHEYHGLGAHAEITSLPPAPQRGTSAAGDLLRRASDVSWQRAVDTSSPRAVAASSQQPAP